jgi:hypothetical protein
MRYPRWDKRIGSWIILPDNPVLRIDGTTPRNADQWTFNIGFAIWDLWLSWGPDNQYSSAIYGKPFRPGRHFGILFWHKDRLFTIKE